MGLRRYIRTPLWIRLLLLVPLPVILILIYWAGQQERPGLFEATVAGGAGPGVGLPVSLGRSGFNLVDTVRVYDENNLYEKIDGHDVAFFRFGFESLTFASYSSDGVAYVDVYVYRMNRRENALGIFAGERSAERRHFPIRDAGYFSGGAAFFFRGPWYVQITPSEAGGILEPVVAEIVDSLVRALPSPEAPLAQLRWFPPENLIPGSEGFLPDAAFGTDFLGELFTAEYGSTDTPMRAFRHESDSAASVYARYTGFLTNAAQDAGTETVGGWEVHGFDAYGEETWVTSKGTNLIGVTGVTDRQAGLRIIEQMIRIAEQADTQS